MRPFIYGVILAADVGWRYWNRLRGWTWRGAIVWVASELVGLRVIRGVAIG